MALDASENKKEAVSRASPLVQQFKPHDLKESKETVKESKVAIPSSPELERKNKPKI